MCDVFKEINQAINVKCIEIIVTKKGGRRKTSNHPSLVSLYYEENLKVHTSLSCFGKKN
jgi:diphthamide synthase subunit DPH2